MNQVAKVEEQSLPPKTAAIASGGSVKSVVPQNLDDVYRLASLIAVSGMAPKDFRSKEQITIAILHGMEIGLKPMQALQRIAVINGRPTLWGDAMLGLVQASGLMADITESFEGKEDGFKAVCIVKRHGRPSAVIGEFSIADSKRAGLFGKAGPHTQYRDRMLKMRARAFALRDAFPDVLGGMYTTEEALDMEPIKDITPAKERPQRADFEQKQVATDAKSAETVDAETGEVNEYSAADAHGEGAQAKADGKTLADMPHNVKAFPNLAEAWTDGFNSEAE